MAEYTPENIGEPFRKLQMAMNNLSLQGRAFLLNLSEFKAAVEGAEGLAKFVEDLEDRMKEEPSDTP